MISGRCCLISAIRCLSEFSKQRCSNGNARGVICSDSLGTLDKRKVGSRFGRNKIAAVATRMASSGQEGGGQQLPKQNRLALEKSPYLLQHASNPVEWYPWGDEALEKARSEDKPIFLSVGYSTCHWCHVMARESFENARIAQIMNRYFINIKVDREERPDIDKIYMMFIQSTLGHGGWPMSVFLTPNLVPITGGTYFPPGGMYGAPGFDTILLTIARKWQESKQDLMKSGSEIFEVLKRTSDYKTRSNEKSVPSLESAEECVSELSRAYDEEYGGFSRAPKFPQPVNLNLLFHYYARHSTSESGKEYLAMCLHTLTKMANGGIHDHVGQGFARYSVDRKWHVPHFEKMLYDQGQLLCSYADAYLASKDPFFTDIIDDIVTYVTRDLRHDDGGFYSAEDADSKPDADSTSKIEGAFYVWTLKEIETHLDKTIPNSKNLRLCDIFSHHFNVKEDGNAKSDPHGELRGKNVLIIQGSVEETAAHFDCTVDDVKKYLSESLKILYDARSSRPRPHLDDKIVTAWNGLIISGLSQAGAATKNKKYIDYAENAAKFVERYLFDKENKILLRSCYRGENNVITQPSVPINGFHTDYAFLVKGLLDLYEATLNDHWLGLAEELQDIQDELFWDDDNGGYYNTTMQDRSIILRLKDDYDGAEPSSNSVACGNLLRLSSCFDRPDYKDKATKLLISFGPLLNVAPATVPELVSALLHYHDSTTQIFIAGKKDAEDTDELVNVVRQRLIPARALLLVDPGDTESLLFRRNELTGKMKALRGRATAYVCRRHTCSLPVADPAQLADLLDSET